MEKLPLKLETVIFMALVHLGALLGFKYFTWNAFYLCLILCFCTGCLGITICYHRLLTHGSFTCNPIIKYLFTIFGVLAWQMGPVSWVMLHRKHHQYSDTDKDPHSPIKSFLWAHLLWMFYIRPDEFYKYVPDLEKDTGLVIIEDLHYIINIAFIVLLWLVGGMPFLVWGFFIRTVIVWHGTWTINSLCHVVGYRNFKTKDTSKNVWWLWPITYGENFHNNHHFNPTSAKHGLRWFEIDISYAIIKFLERLGLASNIKT